MSLNLNTQGDEWTGARWYDLEDDKTGAVRRVFLWIPAGDPPKNGWRALYMTDGNAVIGTAIDVMRTQACYPAETNVQWGVLVAIGYPTNEAYDPLRRSWDLGPPPGRTYPPFYEGAEEVRTGGGQEMIRFIEEQVRPFVGAQTTLDPDQQGLFGHSFGGLFALWWLFREPTAFKYWIAASPAITWEDSFLLEHLDDFKTAPGELIVHLSAGEWEGDRLAPFQRTVKDAESRLKERAETQTIAAAEDMAKKLANIAGVSAFYETYRHENHMSVLPVAVNRAIQCVFECDAEP
ncbi:MAG: alpha/beta hydrolase-fold protein [Pseudomonadota bacterium]